MQEVLQNDEKFSKVDRETVEAINLFAGTDIDIDEKEEVIDMCKAWEEQKNEGREEGRKFKLLEQLTKKLRKDKTPETIAEELEEDADTIRHLCAVAKNFAPDYNLEQIYNAIYKKDN